MKKTALLAALILSSPIQAKTMNYVVMPTGEVFCLPSGSRLQPCKAETIQKRGGIIKNDGVFRSVSYEPFAKPLHKKCGVVYNPKDGKSYKYQDCGVNK